ncbi:MAG: Endopeptidase, cell wall lytic activity [Parcubacteria group bacterium GW2011_GWF2_38_8]|nr:MAG: Endopeptidase, cell wall lytic activity [Parcubacteria group bacterium GW2011_GWF2_38_8]
MPRLPVLTSKKLLKIFLQEGFVVVNRKIDNITKTLDSHTEMIGVLMEDTSELKSDMITVKEDLSTGKETTYFGEATLSALKAFQISNQLTADGILGANTRAVLEK